MVLLLFDLYVPSESIGTSKLKGSLRNSLFAHFLGQRKSYSDCFPQLPPVLPVNRFLVVIQLLFKPKKKLQKSPLSHWFIQHDLNIKCVNFPVII